MCKVLLLGGSGTLSKAVLEQAVKKGCEIWVFNRGNHNCYLPKGIHIIVGDFKDRVSLKQKIKNLYFDVVVDFLSRIPLDIKEVYPIFQDICSQYIFISSACVYRRSQNDLPVSEKSPKPNNDWHYSVEKYECELMLMKLSKYSSSFYTIVRPYITYNKERIPFGIAPSNYSLHGTIIKRIKSGKPMFVWDNGIVETTLTYVDDFAVGVVGLFMNKSAVNEDFHITSNFTYSWNAVLEQLYNKLEVTPNYVSLSVKQISELLPNFKGMLIADRALNALFDNSKIKQAVPELDFSISLDKGIDNILAYYSSLPFCCYDYSFDGQIDRLLASVGVKTNFINYGDSPNKTYFIYSIYKYLPYKIADRLFHLFIER